jgi:hypothetical protein
MADTKPPYPDHECEGCNQGKKLMIGKPSGIVGKAAIHLPEGWVCEKWVTPKVHQIYLDRKAAKHG